MHEGGRVLLARRQQSGVTILELSLAIFLLLMTTVYVMGMFWMGSGLPVKAQVNAKRNALAQQKMDEELALTFANVQPVPTSSCSDPDYKFEVKSEPAPIEPAAKQVTVIVTDANGTRSVLVCIRTPPPSPPVPNAAPDDAPSGAPSPAVSPVPPPLDVIGRYGCTGCHTMQGVDGNATYAPTLNAEFLAAQAQINNVTVAQLVQTKLSDPTAVRYTAWYADKPPNYPVPMNAYTDIPQMAQSDRQELVDYLSSLKPKPAAPVSPGP